MKIKVALSRENHRARERTEKAVNAQVREWSAWSKSDAATVTSPTTAKNINTFLQIEICAAWTNKGSDYDVNLQP
eukprot:2219120-Pyramimonas_sp.AAC.1